MIDDLSIWNAADLARQLRRYGLVKDDSREILLYIAANYSKCRLRDGQRLNDATDVSTFLVELASELKPKPCEVIKLRSQLDKTCPRCGHQHEGDRECGSEIGGGRLCRCEMELPV